MSGPSSATGSPNIVAASSNATPCLTKFAAAFFPSHSNTYLVYTELGRGRRMPATAPGAQRPPACLAGDHEGLERLATFRRNRRTTNCLRKSIANSGSTGAVSRDRSLFSICVRPHVFLRGEIGEFLRNWRARRDSNAGPRLGRRVV